MEEKVSDKQHLACSPLSSLTSFLLKGPERLAERYIRGKALRSHRLNENQPAYQCGKSCESALHLVTKIKDTALKGEYEMEMLVDIERAFSCAPLMML